MTAVQKYGSQCLNLVAKATECIQATCPEEAQKHLATIKETVPLLLQQLENQKEKIAAARDTCVKEDGKLQRKIAGKRSDQEKKNRKIQTLRNNKTSNEALLRNARDSLSKEKSNKRGAQVGKYSAIAGTVGMAAGGGVGAAVLGVIFPPSLFLTVPVVVTAGTISTVGAALSDMEVDRYKDIIRDIELDIESEEQQLKNIKSEIYKIEGEITSLNSKQRSLHHQLGLIRKDFVFLQKAVRFFSEIHVAVCAGDHKTDLLHKVIKLANESKEYNVSTVTGRSPQGGTTICANYFADAWEQVENKLHDGDENGYLRNSFP